jgi:hypothetical protein
VRFVVGLIAVCLLYAGASRVERSTAAHSEIGAVKALAKHATRPLTIEAPMPAVAASIDPPRLARLVATPAPLDSSPALTRDTSRARGPPVRA